MFSAIHYITLHNKRLIPISDIIQNHIGNHGVPRKTPTILVSLAVSCTTEDASFSYTIEYGGIPLGGPKTITPTSEPTPLPLRPLEQCTACGLKQWSTLELVAAKPKEAHEPPYELKLIFTIKTITINQELIQQVLEAQDIEKQAALLTRLLAQR